MAGDFIGFLFRRNLAEGQAAFTGPGADPMQRTQPVLVIVRATHRLAVDGNGELAVGAFAQVILAHRSANAASVLCAVGA